MAIEPPPTSRRPLLILGAVLAVVALAIAAVLLRPGGGSSVLPLGATYTEGIAGTWERLNPIYATTNDVDRDLSQLIFSGLVRLGPNGDVQPDLAELPTVTEEGRTYTFRLRRNLKWHDGQPLTSADVAFTISRITATDFKGEATLAEAWAGVQVETPDDSTVVIRLRQAYAPFLARRATLGILPAHLLSTLNPAELYEAPFNATPIGTGPYRLQSIDTREATLIANPDYHLGRPAIGTIKLRFFTDYPSALRALETGQLDGLMVRDTMTTDQLASLDRLKGFQVATPQRSAYLLLYLNNDQTLFQDDRVRRALSLALDRTRIADIVFAGQATPSTSAITPGTWAYAKEYDRTQQDIEAARRLLNDAGWQPNPTTRILIREGQEFRFTIRTDNDPQRLAAANEIARQLETLGIRANVASTTFSVLLRDFLQERKYDAAVAGWEQGPDPDPYSAWHSSQMGAAGLNIGNFADPVVDELIGFGRTRIEPEVRKDAYRQFQEKWEELAPGLILAYPRYPYIRRSGIQGQIPTVLATPAHRFSEIHRWEP